MRKTPYAIVLILALLFSVEAQVVMVMANPHWPFPDAQYPDWGHPKITITSPVQNGSYPQNDVWLNLTVTKPSNWTDFEGQLKYVAYLIDGDRNKLTYASYNHNVGETRVAVEDPLGVANPLLEFDLSIKLEGLSDGNHHKDIAAEGLVKNGTLDVSVGSVYNETINFNITGGYASTPASPAPSPNLTPTPTTSPEQPDPVSTTLMTGVPGAIMIILFLGLLVHFKKRKQ
jgi:hypothetical protein